ncbi:MAG: integrase/recombinase XerD [Flavobacteriales bacterium]|jgi:integrase/recombinase XerD
MNWKDALIDYQNYLKLERGLSKNSVMAYIRDLEKFTGYLEIQNIDISPISLGLDDLKSYIHFVAESINARSQSRYISAFRSFFHYLQLEKYRDDNPAKKLEIPKLKQHLPDTLNVEEIDKIISVVDLSKPEGERNRAIIETLYGCGLRASELIGLKLSNIYFNEGLVKVLGKGNKQRWVPLADITAKFLKIYIREVRNHQEINSKAKDIVFINRRGNGLSRVMIFNIVKSLVELAGLRKTISPHTFRHSFASHMVQGGADLRTVQQILGHESITTTEIYTHVDEAYLTSIIQFHPRA